jgi:pimeloyl-ACP methyl ester carboxylesterase
LSFDGTQIRYDVYDASPRRRRRSRILARPPSCVDVRLAHYLVGRGYRAVVMDPRGHGDSEGTYGFNQHEQHDVTVIREVLQNNATIGGVALIGFRTAARSRSPRSHEIDLPLSSILLISSVADFSMITPRLNPF